MLLGVVSESGASVLDVVHSRTAPKLALDEVEVMLTVETRGPAAPGGGIGRPGRRGIRRLRGGQLAHGWLTAVVSSSTERGMGSVARKVADTAG